MESSQITPHLLDALQHATSELIACIRRAIQDFETNPPPGSETWESWHTPFPWENCALPNLARYQIDLISAISAYHAGRLEPIVRTAASYVGLSRDMDFDMTWMSEENRTNVTNSIDKAVDAASQIHRLGYEAVTKMRR